jgi:DNA-binding GntR family transcriptional regulator
VSAAEQPLKLVRSVETASLVDKVAIEIRRSILNGTLKPGQQFSLRQISSQLGVSFIPVREAITKLEAQGLVITARGKSATIAALDSTELRSIYRLRRQLEPELAARSCTELTAENFNQARKYLAEFGSESSSLEEAYEAHHNFHLELLKPAATTWDIRILESLWHAAERYIELAFDSTEIGDDERNRRMEIHRELMEQFQLGDPARAEAAVLQHLNENEQFARSAIDQLEVQANGS